MAQVSVRKVEKQYDTYKAVHGIDLEIADEEFVVLVGPSGCGKSTTLRMIAGLEEITAGEIWIGGNMVNDVPPRDRDIAMVFQNYALYPHMTVFENMAFGLKLRKFPKAEIKTRWTRRRASLTSSRCWNASPRRCRAGSGSAWRWGGPSCATRRCSCSTSRCPTSTPSCALVGWKAVMDSRTSAECAAANGKNFPADRPPVIGWPGAVHPHCRCVPTKPYAGAGMVDESAAVARAA